MRKKDCLKRTLLLLVSLLTLIVSANTPLLVNAVVLPGDLTEITSKGISRLDPKYDDCVPGVSTSGCTELATLRRTMWNAASLNDRERFVHVVSKEQSGIAAVEAYMNQVVSKYGDGNDGSLGSWLNGQCVRFMAGGESTCGQRHDITTDYQKLIDKALDGSNVTNFAIGNATGGSGVGAGKITCVFPSGQDAEGKCREDVDLTVQDGRGVCSVYSPSSEFGECWGREGADDWAADMESKCASSNQNNTASGSSSSTPANGDDYSEEQVRRFAHQPINASFGVTDSTVEEWFLGTGTAVINRYGLNQNNIGEITAVIKAHSISVALFYGYTVQEGGGAGGFINHYGNEAAGGAVGNATRDAQYLVEHAKIMDSNPSWADAGNWVDFVPQSVKDAGNADFQSMPSGTIGRVYIPATAAATWEVYYPDGLKAEFNKVQNYGAPLQGIMKAISAMGGDPLQDAVNECDPAGAVIIDGMAFPLQAKKMSDTDKAGDTSASDGRIVNAGGSLCNLPTAGDDTACHHGSNLATQSAFDIGAKQPDKSGFYASEGATVYAIADGVLTSVTHTRNGAACNAFILTRNDSDQTFWYGHMAGDNSINTGMEVKAGDVVGHVGSVTCADNTAPHVHIEMSTTGNHSPGPGGDSYPGRDPAFIGIMNKLYGGLSD